MRQIRSAALSRHTAPDFVLQHGLELIQLRKLDDFAFRLFIELCAMADFMTGYVRTSHPVLIALLDFDQAPRAHFKLKPTKRRLRTAFDELCSLNLVRDFDKKRNEAMGGLFFRVANRQRMSAPATMSAPMSAPQKKRRSHRENSASIADERTDERTGVQEKNSLSYSPLLSTGPTASKPDAVKKLREFADARRGGKK